MTTRRRRSDVGAARARELVATIGRDVAGSRTNAGLSQAAVAGASGLSRSRYGRIERGLSPEVSVAAICRIAAVLGLEASLRLFPDGDPVRDAAQLALLERLRSVCHPLVGWQTEVVFRRPGDRRAWDAVLRLPPRLMSLRIGIEAETRPNDAQALERKLALKERDGRRRPRDPAARGHAQQSCIPAIAGRGIPISVPDRRPSRARVAGRGSGSGWERDHPDVRGRAM